MHILNKIIKKWRSVALITSLLVLTPLGHAGPSDTNGIKTWAYINLAFGGNRGQKTDITLGLTVNHTYGWPHTNYGENPSVSLLDLRLNTLESKPSVFHIGGIDMLNLRRGFNVDESTIDSGNGISSGVAIGLMVVGLGIFVGNQTEKNIDTVSSALNKVPAAIAVAH